MATKKPRYNRTRNTRSGKFANFKKYLINKYRGLGRLRMVLFVGLFAAIGGGLLYLTHAQTQISVACPTVPGATVSSGYGWRQSTASYHAGLDVGVSFEPIYAAESGRVIFAGANDGKYWGYQRTIDLQGASGRVYRYAHLGGIDVSVGQGVQAGQKIGTSGDGDGALPAHLHWEIRTDGGGTGFNGTINPSWAYDNCGGNTPPAGAVPTTGGINNPGTDCHNYVLRYDPSRYYPCVRHLQVDIGFSDSEANGYFDDITKESVENFQRSKGLVPDGIVGPQTWRAIHPDLGGTAPTPTPAPAAPSSQAVQGRIFRDDNGNGAREGNEPLIGSAGACGNYVNVDASVAAAGHHVNADRCMDGPFYFIPTGVGTVTVTGHVPSGWSHTNGNSRTVNVAAGQHVDVQWFGMRPTPAAAPVHTPPPAGTTTTTPAPAAQGSKAIIGVGSNRCMDVAGGNRGNGGTVLLWDCHGQANQQWAFSGNAIKVYGNKCLDIFGFNSSNMAEVGIWDCHGQANQQWYRPGDGTIRSNLNGKCLDVEGYGTHNGARILMYDCHVGSNQRWR